MIYVVLKGNQIIINGKSFPLLLPKESLLESLERLILVSSGGQSPKIGINFLKDFGQRLYKAISPVIKFPPGPIFLDIQERGLSQFPWELMCDEGEFLAKTRGIVRVAGPGASFKGGNIKGPLKVLVALASPLYNPGANEESQPDPINLRSQIGLFTQGLSRKRFAATFNIQQHITRRCLGDELVKDYDVLHFVGHGSRGCLSLEDDNACVDDVESNWLRENLSESSLHLAVFNSCYTASHDPENTCAGIAKTLLDAGIPLVVGMQLAISEGAARVFAHKFYRALAEGKSVIESMTMSRRAIADCATCRPWEWLTPVLFIQPDVLKSSQEPFVLYLPATAKASIHIRKPKKLPLLGLSKEDFFVGRRKEIVQILKTLSFTPYQQERVVVLKGSAGVGKTALAIQAAEHMLKRVDRIVWVSGRTCVPGPELAALIIGNDGLTLVRDEKSLFTQMARNLKIKLQGSEDLLLIKEKLLRRLGTDKKTLLVLDSRDFFWDSEVLHTFINQLPLNCCTLITSRHEFPSIKARQMLLPSLSRIETFKFVRYHLRQALEESILQQIYTASEGNPLVICLFLAQYGGKDTNPLEFQNQLSQGQPGYLFDYMFQQSLNMLGSKEREVFTVLSLFKHQASSEALTYICRLTNISYLAEKLKNFSLVRIDEKERVSLCSLGRVMAAKLCQQSSVAENLRARKALFMARLFRTQFKLLEPQVVNPLVQQVLDEEEFLGEVPLVVEQVDSLAIEQQQQKIQDLLQQTIYRTALETMSDEKENALSALAWCAAKSCLPLMYILVDTLSLFCALRCHWEEVVRVNKMALQPIQGQDRREEAVLLNNMGMAYRHLGNWSLAQKCLQKAIKQKEKLGDVYGLAQSYNNLGLVYKSQGSWKKSLAIYQRNLSLFHQLSDTKSKANTYNNMGLLYQSQGNWEKALVCYQKALTLKEELQDIVGVARTLSNLGLVQQNLKHWKTAQQMYQQSLETFSRLGNIHAMGQTYSNLGLLSYDQEQYKSAIKFYEKALDVFSEVRDVFGVAQAYNNLGLVYKDLEDTDKALAFYQKSLDLKQELGDVHGLAQTLNNLGVVYKGEENWDAARDCYRQAIELKYRIGDVQGMGLSYANLGLLEFKCKNYDSALKFLERAANLFVEVGDEENLQKVMNALLAVNLKLQD